MSPRRRLGWSIAVRVRYYVVVSARITSQIVFFFRYSLPRVSTDVIIV